MRIQVYCDGYILMDTRLESFKIVNPKVTQEVNKVGSFTFTIYPDHPYYNIITKMKSIITVYEEGVEEPLFRGRVYDEKAGFHNEKQVSCEGELAFLLDSIQRPWEFTGTPAELFTKFIEYHNSQMDATRQFAVGNITVTDANNYITRSNSGYSRTWDEINDKLIKGLGGYLWTRHQDGITYIDYLQDFNVLSNQPIEFGKNLVDLSKQIKADSFATALIPLGAKIKDAEGNDTEERLTIAEVNGGVDYVYNADAVAIHGYIFTTNTWDDVTVASNLKTKGQAYIDSMAQFTSSINVSAADLNGATINGEPVNVNSFRIGRYVEVKTKPHGIDQNFIVSKLTRELLKPESTKLTLGATFKSLTQKQKEIGAIKGEPGVAGKDGKDGADGKGIASTAITYQASTSGTTAPTGTWTTTIPTVSANQYLWTRTVITYTDKATSTAYSVGKMGANGSDGSPGKDGANGKDGKDAAIQSTTAPTDTSYMWLDISSEPPILKRYNSTTSAWEIINDTTAIVDSIVLLEQNLSSEIAKNNEEVLITVSESYYAKDEVDTLVNEVSTELSVEKDAVEIRFNQFSQNLDDIANGTDAQFQEINKYIRFVDGNIVLGEVDNELVLKIQNDRISFLQSNTEVAYFSNRKLYVKDLELTEEGQAKFGDFAWFPRTNGNLSFKKI